jgi:hypothetical protein
MLTDTRRKGCPDTYLQDITLGSMPTLDALQNPEDLHVGDMAHGTRWDAAGLCNKRSCLKMNKLA